MDLSLSGFLFEENYASQSVEFSEFCGIAKSAGYDGVELRRTQVNPDTPIADRKGLLETVRDAGLTVTCLTARRLPTSGLERDEVFLRYLELCQDMNCGLLKINGDAAWLHEAAAKAEEYGVTLASNNHIGSALETVEGTRRFFDEVAHPNFGLLYDSLHLRAGGDDYLGCIPEFLGITRNILVHSIREARPGDEPLLERQGKRWSRAMPDEPGVQDWAGIVSSFKRLGYDGLITVIENGWPADRREYVARHYSEVIRRMWAIAAEPPPKTA